ncbi:MAG: hypothetical protein P6D50_02325 [Acidimicrobiales bacterium]|nr:hypothetical protein [Acidimicrobiales bacterium]
MRRFGTPVVGFDEVALFEVEFVDEFVDGPVEAIGEGTEDLAASKDQLSRVGDREFELVVGEFSPLVAVDREVPAYPRRRTGSAAMRLLQAHEVAARRAAIWYDKRTVHHRASLGAETRIGVYAPRRRIRCFEAERFSKFLVTGGTRIHVVKLALNTNMLPCEVKRLQGRAMSTPTPLKRHLVGINRAKAIFVVAGLVSFFLSVGLWFSGNELQGIFVGLWVPSIHSLGALVLAGSGASS